MTKKKDLTNLLLEEWKECRTSIDRFDRIIVDMRKFGFTFMTILFSAGGFLFATTELSRFAKLGIFFSLMVLIYGLFLIDRYHEIFLRAAVLRAIEIENALDFEITGTIEHEWSTLKTATWGIKLYLLFCLADILLALFSEWQSIFTIESIFFNLSILLTAIIFLLLIYNYHHLKKIRKVVRKLNGKNIIVDDKNQDPKLYKILNRRIFS